MLDLAAHRKDRTVVLVAALVLLLQVFFTAWTTGAMASGALPMDDWGNPLCITSVEDGSAPDSGKIAIPNCCAMGCCMAATILPGPPCPGNAIRADAGNVEVPFPRTGAPPVKRAAHDPGSPRAPPLTG